MARKDSCAGTTLGIAVDDIRACFNVASREARWLVLGMDVLRHTCVGCAEETRRSVHLACNKQKAVARRLFVVHGEDQEIANHRDIPLQIARIPPIVVVEDAPRNRDRNIPISDGAALNADPLQLQHHALEAARLRPLSTRRSAAPVQLCG